MTRQPHLVDIGDKGIRQPSIVAQHGPRDVRLCDGKPVEGKALAIHDDEMSPYSHILVTVGDGKAVDLLIELVLTSYEPEELKQTTQGDRLVVGVVDKSGWRCSSKRSQSL